MDQDWTTVTIKKRGKVDKKTNGSVSTINTTHTNSQYSNNAMHKMDTDDYKPTLVSSSVGQQIIQARLAKQWNQEQLAKNSQIPISIIKSYENPGPSTVINHQYLQKIGRVLGVSIKTKN
jgi:ribosome-binding protein aMBF1 (putative translation factor)